MLKSFVTGRWVEPQGDGVSIEDAVTGAEIARASSAGIDVAAALAYGRRHGGRALRALTFHERAGLLKALGLFLKDHRAELYELSTHAGATLADARIDVDGGIGVLLSYASRAVRELPDDTVILDGPLEPLGRTGQFVAQHVLTSRPGIVVQINAFNFPVWGPLEKLAPTLLAGLPTLIKPATPTAYVTVRLVELVLKAGVLPEGALQLVCGRGEGILDHLGGQDAVAFTGSATTARQLAAQPSVLNRGVRFQAETDSLNCSILGPDATPGTPEFDLFIAQLVGEMTAKAGQKCTAIRRALVPAHHVGAVVDATRARLAAVVVGHPADPAVTMGPLVSRAHREGVRRAVTALRTAGRLVAGDPANVAVLGADPEHGAFLAPQLLVVDDPTRPEPHEIEAFGPVSTVLGYSDPEDAILLATRGRGSLAGSVVTADATFARKVVRGLAPWHGRILVLDRDAAGESTGHGSPLPMLVHGGPGRAGGGEELGGMRSVRHHLQRTAVQASPRLLAAVTDPPATSDAPA
ncbi:MAG: phenylacetic acid degradation bifunctional protein PaaZ [Thermaerobacter sp.]|nr:phenylacetic acid degradation bifunctional protein PaaZ [Thermaerobacter sp.]